MPRFTPDQRELAVSLYRDGMKAKEVAEKIGCSEDSVRKWSRKENSQKTDDVVNPTWHDPHKIILPPFVLRRHDERGLRFYYTLDGISPSFYIGVTSMTGAVMPKDESLIKWIANFPTWDAYKEELSQLADRGTLMHIIWGLHAFQGTDMGIDNFRELCRRHCEEIGRGKKFLNRFFWFWYKSLISFQQFVYEHEVEFYGIELPVKDDDMEIATQIDFVASMKFGQKRVNAILDAKSGSTSSRSYAVQLELCKRMFATCYPDAEQPTHLFNLAPKNWNPPKEGRPEPKKYILTNQTNKVGEVEIQSYINLSFYYAKRKFKPIFEASGLMTTRSDPNNYFQFTEIDDYISHKQ